MIEQKLDNLEKRLKELEKLLSDPKILSNPEEYKQYTREHSSILPTVQKYQELKEIDKEISNLEELKKSSEPEIKELAETEYVELNNKKEKIMADIKLSLIHPDPNEDKNIIIEIRAGTGGEEAALFAGDLLRMYCRYAESKKWKIELMDSHPTGLGGFKEVIFMVSGKNVWRHFKFESGVHRVQRVPVTEASGRIHTSAISVAVLPEAEEIEVGVKPEELRIDTYRASGAGGQHVNKTDSAVRITHIPTGIVVACQDERSQIKNRAKAMRILLAKILEKKQKEQEQEIVKNRRKQIGSGDRSEKIRTYNFPQNRITDHRINYNLYRLEEVLDGDMDELVHKLISVDQQEKLLEENLD